MRKGGVASWLDSKLASPNRVTRSTVVILLNVPGIVPKEEEKKIKPVNLQNKKRFMKEPREREKKEPKEMLSEIMRGISLVVENRGLSTLRQGFDSPMPRQLAGVA